METSYFKHDPLFKCHERTLGAEVYRVCNMQASICNIYLGCENRDADDISFCLGSSVSHTLCELNPDSADIRRVRYFKFGWRSSLYICM